MDITVKGNEMYIDNKSNSISLTTKNGVVVEQTNEDVSISTTPQTIGVELPKEIPTEGGKVQDVYVNGESVLDKNGIAQINNVVQDENYVHTDNNYSNKDKEKLSTLQNYDDTEIKEQLENKAEKTDIPDTSEFITKSVNDLINYYNKDQINELAMSIQTVNIVVVDTLPIIGESNVIYFVKKDGSENDIYDEWIYINNKWEHIGNTQIDLTDYATKKWVREQNYMPISDFQEYMNYFHYTKTEVDTKINDLADTVYSKEEVDTKLENLPTGTELVAGDNTVIEDNHINVYTNTGYKVSDKDIKLQTITDSETTGINKMAYVDGKEIEIIYDGSNKIRRSVNGIKFDIITLPCNCKDLVYNADAKRLYGTDATNYFIYSNDFGLTWNTILSSYAKNTDYLSIGFGAGFKGIVKNTRKVNNYTFNENGTISVNSTITSAITPEFLAMINKTQFVWCNSTGTFKYGAGSNEGDFASLSGIIVNMLKRINDITFLGLKNSNKFYILEPATSVRDYKWIPYTLPDTCTVNDIIYNPYDQTYYILNNVNTYYKTKDFEIFESIDTGLRPIQGYFTLMGIQGVTSNHDELFLAPTRTTLEDKLQEHDRDLNKSLWVGKGLKLTEKGEVEVASASSSIGVNASGIFLIQVEEHNLTDETVESIYVSVAEIDDNFDPYNMDSWFWEFGYPSEKNYKATKLVFNQDGSFWNQTTWETEYIVEKNEYGYIFADNSGSIFKYVKLGKFTRLLGGE